MKISRFGNNSSKVLDSLVEQANKEAEKQESPSFEKIASNVLSQNKQTLKDVLAQLEVDPGLDDDMGELPGEVGGDMPTDEGDTDGAKRGLVDALIALCGGPEEAKACLDEYSTDLPGEDTMEGLPEEGMMMDESPTDAPLDMPKPMDMPATPEPAPAPTPAPAPAAPPQPMY